MLLGPLIGVAKIGFKRVGLISFNLEIVSLIIPAPLLLASCHFLFKVGAEIHLPNQNRSPFAIRHVEPHSSCVWGTRLCAMASPPGKTYIPLFDFAFCCVVRADSTNAF